MNTFMPFNGLQRGISGKVITNVPQNFLSAFSYDEFSLVDRYLNILALQPPNPCTPEKLACCTASKAWPKGRTSDHTFALTI